ncbi:MAG: hypothetical protein IPM99_17625 [Rubrivivax sp.]|nr:hypothetical protein [Rubrivivax sp.]
MKRRGTKGKVIIIDASPNPMPMPIAAPIVGAMKSLYAARIEYVTNTEVSAVDIGRRLPVTPTGDIGFTAANMVLPMRAPALIRSARLGERWAAVKPPSFLSQVDDKILSWAMRRGHAAAQSGHLAFGWRQAGRRRHRAPHRRPAGAGGIRPGDVARRDLLGRGDA